MADDPIPTPLPQPPDWVPVPPAFVGDWELMDTAPKDGRDILVARAEGRQLIAHWHEPDGWVALGLQQVNPTHWRELPAPPVMPVAGTKPIPDFIVSRT